MILLIVVAVGLIIERLRRRVGVITWLMLRWDIILWSTLLMHISRRHAAISTIIEITTHMNIIIILCSMISCVKVHPTSFLYSIHKN